jgi:hypothetical protein
MTTISVAALAHRGYLFVPSKEIDCLAQKFFAEGADDLSWDNACFRGCTQ